MLNSYNPIFTIVFQPLSTIMGRTAMPFDVISMKGIA